VAITKAKKQEIIAKLEAVKKDAKTLVFVHFEKLPVKDSTQMRAKLRQEGVGFVVAKKTLMKRVFAGYEGTMPELDGEIAVAYSEDEMAPAQNMKEFGAKYKESLSIVGGIFQGVYRSKEEMIKIASIPSLQVLRGMFAQIINSPRQRFAVVLSEVAKSKN
jgi:large subunit ribosomal protein L10